MDWLPDELLLNILGWLTQPELSTCMRVCQRWNRLCNDATFWQEIVLDFKQITKNPPILGKVTQQHPHLRSLVILGSRFEEAELSGTKLEEFVGVQTWNRLGTLNQVTLLNCPQDYLECIPSIIDSCCKTLKCFRCEDANGFLDQHFQFFFTNPLMEYKELSLAHCTLVTNLAIFESQHNPNFAKCLKSLSTLNLDGTGVDSFTDDGVLGMLEVCPLLKALSLDGENLTDRTPEYIGRNLPTLEQLAISFCSHLTDTSLRSLSNLKQLKSLKLRKGENFTTGGFLHLFDGLKQDHTNSSPLRHLSLIQCLGLKDMALLKLAESFPDLSSLDISWCWDISDVGLEAVALHCRNLTSLTLGGLGSCRGTAILEAPMPRLRYLGLVQSSLIDDDQLVELKGLKPWMTIIDYYDSEVVL